MKLLYALGLSFILASSVNAQTQTSSEAAFKQLMEGNQRFMNDTPRNVGSLAEARKDLVDGQEPFAIIIGCSDSRVPPEIVFDQSLGDLFVVRVAGNVMGIVELDSIEYAVVILECPLIMVLGHENCGAVKAVLDGKADENELEGIVPFLKKAMKQAQNMPGDLLVNTVKTNVKLMMQTLESKSELKDAIKKKKLKVIGGYYELESGQVNLIK